ncbi:hypothetical protein Rsub_01883 [Raphidocelis subcapitata]|uniref:PH domain-containing protein n=1 Tax=Raphidocelis subcapitata TaxID=307507 RepID=A0A2V0NNM4_9CHLO|nr:hypothetical protein Rsub_01883 [Raphidocelis subcapitata]|eukprot:GBF89166.1 hypothetical protein Rsub_01883 [Raphidocelis subcapitata]
MAEQSVSDALEAKYDGFKACFGGEELKRACATLSGALVNSGSKAQTPLQALAEDADLHVRELAFAARQYAAALARAPDDYDALYNHGLVLQELSGRLAPASPDQIAFLRQACERYEAALSLRPQSHQALYNWGVALSDLARALKPSAPSEALACLHLASQKYAASLHIAPGNPQALNNWGLVLQELSADARDWRTRDALVRHAMDKFRLAIRARPDFDRGCYNLGTVFYTFACAMQSEQGQPKDAPARAGRDAAARALFGTAAQYIALAAALQPAKDIYRKSLAVVRQMLPLPFLRAGYLSAPLPRGLGGLGEVYRREWFVLDHHSLRAANHMESTLSAASQGVPPQQQQQQQQQRAKAAAAAAAAAEEDPLVLELSDIVAVRRCNDPSLPEGEAFWVGLSSRPLGVYLVADTADAANAWVDALVLAQHLVATRSHEALAEALTPQPSRRPKQAALVGAGGGGRQGGSPLGGIGGGGGGGIL